MTRVYIYIYIQVEDSQTDKYKGNRNTSIVDFTIAEDSDEEKN